MEDKIIYVGLLYGFNLLLLYCIYLCLDENDDDDIKSTPLSDIVIESKTEIKEDSDTNINE